MASTVQKPHSAPKLQDEAALAALYVTKYDKSSSKGADASSKDGQQFLDADRKLSSAGAAASLKYAKPQDLPGFPVSGLKNSGSAAGAAASLGWANQKPFEHWKPDPSAPAAAAALSAKDYKMKELWQPEQSAHGAKAALLAAKDGGKVEIWQPEADSPWGNSAASQAFKKFGAGSLSPVLDYGYTAVGRQGSLLAATGAMSQSRQRALSNPTPEPKPETYPDEGNAVANALSAATSANKAKKRNGPNESGSTPYTAMAREMYTSNPPVAPEVEEKDRADTLRASAVAMAKAMYNVQQKQLENSQAQRAATSAHGRQSVLSDYSDAPEPMRFNNLQEAAQKLAQERLAKLHDEHAQNREYRDYYGDHSQPASRMSVRGRARRRASSAGTADDDKAQSNKIRAQMSLFSSNLSQVDEQKRAKDRENLIAIAQRNVAKNLRGMDERVFADTGKVTPSLLSDWEVKAHAAAQAKSNTRMENYGKVNIGGGKFINQSAVDLVARNNVQPVLDEINEKAAAEHERQAAIKAEQQETSRKASERKQREKETKAINKKLKQQDKEEEKLRIQEEKEAQKAAQRASAAPVVVETANTSAATEAAPTTPREGLAPIRTSMEDQASLRIQQIADDANGAEQTPLSPGTSSPDSKGKSRMSWLKTKFARRMSKSQKGDKESATEEKGFVGGAALTGASANNSTASLGAATRDITPAKKEADATPAEAGSIVEIREAEAIPAAAMSVATEPATEAEGSGFLPLFHRTPLTVVPLVTEDEIHDVGRSDVRDEEVSPIIPDSEHGGTLESQPTNEDEEFQEARDNFDEDLAPPPTFPAEKSHSPARETKFKEVID